MYQAKIHTKRFDQGTQMSVYTVVFTGTSGEPETSKEFKFSVDTSYENILRAIKKAAEDLEVRLVEDGKVVEGQTIDFSLVVPQAVPVENDEFDKWSRQYGKLTTVQKLIELGVLTGSEPFVVTLREKVKNDFKQGFIKLM